MISFPQCEEDLKILETYNKTGPEYDIYMTIRLLADRSYVYVYIYTISYYIILYYIILYYIISDPSCGTQFSKLSLPGIHCGHVRRSADSCDAIQPVCRSFRTGSNEDHESQDRVHFNIFRRNKSSVKWLWVLVICCVCIKKGEVCLLKWMQMVHVVHVHKTRWIKNNITASLELT